MRNSKIIGKLVWLTFLYKLTYRAFAEYQGMQVLVPHTHMRVWVPLSFDWRLYGYEGGDGGGRKEWRQCFNLGLGGNHCHSSSIGRRVHPIPEAVRFDPEKNPWQSLSDFAFVELIGVVNSFSIGSFLIISITTDIRIRSRSFPSKRPLAGSSLSLSPVIFAEAIFLWFLFRTLRVIFIGSGI